MEIKKSIILSTFILLISCHKANEKFTQSEIVIKESTNILQENNNSSEPKNCDEFIEQYNNWMDTYLVIIDKYFTNPMDETVLQEYMELTGESLNWVGLWNSKLGFCTSNERYNSSFKGDIYEGRKKASDDRN